MKHEYTPETIQVAIDAACASDNVAGELHTSPTSRWWEEQADSRLTLARELLERLPEPTPPVVQKLWTVCARLDCPEKVTHYEGSCPECTARHTLPVAVLAAFGGNLEAAIARMEAVPLDELKQEIFKVAISFSPAGTEAVRARLIAAARGQGESVDWKSKYNDLQKRLQPDPGGSDKIDELESANALILARAEKAESELADEKRKRLYAEEHLGILAKTFGYEGRTWCNMVSYLCPRLQKAEEMNAELILKRNERLTQLRPLSEAGPVPAGCVRFYGQFCPDGKWYLGYEHQKNDTHFASIRLPSPASSQPVGINGLTDEETSKTASVVGLSQPADELTPEATKTSPPAYVGYMTDEAPSPTPVATLPSPPWTPKVGDTVKLKSSGPVMTVLGFYKDDDCLCGWHDGAKPISAQYPAACLEPATKEDAQ